MHELGITRRITEIIGRNMPEGGRVTRAYLEIGKLTGLVPDSVRFHFEIITRDTPLEGAELVINEIPVRMACNQCATEFDTEELGVPCPHCGDYRMRPLSGQELLLRSIEVENSPSQGEGIHGDQDSGKDSRGR